MMMKPQRSGFRKGFLLGATEKRRIRRRPERHGEPSAVDPKKERGVEEKKDARIVDRAPLSPPSGSSAQRSVSPGESRSTAASFSEACLASGRLSEGGSEAVPPPTTTTTTNNRRAATPLRLVHVLDDAEGDETDTTPREPQNSSMHEQVSIFASSTSSGGSLESTSMGAVCREPPVRSSEPSEFVRFHSLWRQAHQAASVAMSDGPPTGSRRQRGGDGRQTTARGVLADFLERHVTTDEQWKWCWQHAFSDPPPSSQRRPSRKRLVTHLLMSEMLRTPTGIKSLHDCVTERDADSRAWTLTCLAWLDDVLFHQEHDPLRSGPEQDSLAKVLVVNVLPILVEIVETEVTRTVLAQCAFEGAIGMVTALCDPLVRTRDTVDNDRDDGAMSSLCTDSNDWSAVQDVLFDVIPLLTRLCDVHLSWLERSKLNDSFDKIHHRCRRSVILAWKGCASSAAKRSWCREVCGCCGFDILCPNTLPDSPSCVGFGGLAQTLGSRDKSLSEPTVVAILTAVDRDGDSARRRIALRGLLGWLGQRRKNLERLSRTTILSLLPIIHRWSSNLDALCDLSVSAAVIETLWVCGLGLAPSERSADTADLSDALGESFHSLVAWVAQSRTPVDQRLVALVGNLLILQNDASLLRSLRTQPENVAVEVLLYLIRAHIETDLGATNALRDDATKLLLSKLGGWSSVYEAMKLDPKLFNASNPIDVTCLLANVALEKRAEDSMLPVIVDALVSVLGEQSSVSGGCCACVSSLVESLIRCEDATEKTQKSSFDQFCDELGPRWRRSILYTDALLWVLVSLAEMVLRYPSKLAPLSLFGAVIGNSSDYVKVDCNQNPLVCATKEMVKLALNVMTTQNEPCVTLPSDQAIQRLSPLLLLRRIPRCYYASLADAQDVSQTAAREALYKEVAKEVAIRIGNDVGNETSAESYTVDERRLAAEIAPLLLPAEDLYRWVVFPTYALLTASVESPETCEAKQIPEIRAFRAAFYSGCHVIPFADTASEGNVLLKIASCSLSLLRREIPPTNGGECQEELSRLEAGCIDFLALCIQRLFEVDSCDSVTTTSVSPSRSKSRYPALDALRALHESLTAIALTGWDGKLVDTREGERAAVQYSILTRSRVWNSLLLVAKRCRVEHGHLQRFGAAFAPKTIEWGVSGPMDTSGRHPFCVAAAFQILLTLSVRSASSDWNVVASMDGSLLDQLISWSLSVARSSNRLNSPSTHEARMSAVKLLLSLLASGAFTTDDPNRRVSGQRLLEILSLVNSIAEDDPDAELQKLAVASIQVLRSSDEAQLVGMPTS